MFKFFWDSNTNRYNTDLYINKLKVQKKSISTQTSLMIKRVTVVIKYFLTAGPSS